MFIPENTKSALQTALENAKTISEIIAICIGGLWAYYKFFRGRTFKSRLEFLVSGLVHHDANSAELLASAQMKNIGLSKIRISQRGSALSAFRSLPTGRPDRPTIVEWEQLVVLPVFEKHAWIEPDETIKDQMLIRVDLAESTALKLDLRIVANKIEWNESSIVPLHMGLSDAQNDNLGGNTMARLQEQKKEDLEITRRIELDKLEKQKKEDQKETQRIEHDKVKNKK
jgi:hypothetical protein